MAQGDLKVDEAIVVTYQATGAETGLTDVQMDVYDEAGALIVEDPIVPMTEIAATGRYEKSFTPDAEGKWRVMIDSVTKKGKMVRDFDVVAHNVDSIGDAVATVNTDMAKNATVAKDASVAKDATVAKDASVAKDATVAKAGADGDTLKTLSDQLDGITGSDAPPMIG